MLNNGFIKRSLPFLFLAAPLQAAPSVSLSSSRMVNRSSKVTIEQQKIVQQPESAGAFASFSSQPVVEEKARAAIEDTSVLAFLEQSGLLDASDVVAATNSGNLDSEFNKSLSALYCTSYYWQVSDCKIESITRKTPASSPTNADTLTWNFAFDINVSNVNAADFLVTGTTATVTNVTALNAKSYDVTVSGGDLANLNGTVTITLKNPGNDIVITGSPGPDPILTTVRNTNNNSYSVINNSAPTDISLTSTSVNQSGGTNAVVGTLSSTDADVGDSHTYTLVAGAGDTNNASFNISGSSLRANNAALLAAGTYSVRVRTTDNASATYEEAFTITVVDNVPPAVSSITLSGSPANTDASVDFVVAFDTSANNISIDDFQLTSTGGAAGTISAVSASSGTSVNVTVNSITGNGTLRLDLKSSTDISDGIGNASPAAYTSGSVHNVAIPTAPAAPTIGTATAGDEQVSVTFTAPGNNGGSAITTYTATANPGGAFGTCAGPAACTATVSGLNNGTAYTFTVTATNAIGTSVVSGASNSATPKGNQTITFANPGAQNFGTTPTLTATADSATGTDNLTVTFSSSTTGVCTITSGGALTFVTAGSCTIDADQAGDSATNAATTATETFTVNAIAPGAPTIGTATAGNTQATVTFTPPASTGGAAIIASGYTVTANPGGLTGTGSSSPITVAGLTNGVAYTFTVTAANSAGAGAPSAVSNSIIPASPQTITFANPGTKNFGTSPTLVANSNSGLTVSFTSSTAGVCTVSGTTLNFLTAGTCTINADQAGDSSYLPASQVSQTFSISAVVPGAPTIGTAIAGDTQASVAFVAPVNIGGSAIIGYTVTVNPADVVPVQGGSSPIVVTGLTNGVAYSFTVTADNVAGTGPASGASNSITPAATQTITFAAPSAQNFGTTPTLIATTDATGLTPTFTSSTTGVCTITSGGALTFVSAGTCTINADQAGNGTYLAAPQVTRSFTVNAVVPGAPTIGTATAGNAQATVAFTAPASNGGSPITGYTVTASPGGATATGAGSPVTFTGLTNGTSYTFTVRSTNGVGAGSPSAASNAVTPEIPNTAPVVTSTALASAVTNSLYSYTLTATDPGDTFTFSAVTKPNWLSFNAVSGVLSGTPVLADIGNHPVSLVVTDSGGLTATQSFTLVVTNSNEAPVVTDSSASVEEDNSLSLTLTAQDTNQDELTYEVVAQPEHGTVTVQGALLVYTPEQDFNGSDSVSFIAKDAELSSNTATISLTVTAVNDNPVVLSDSYNLQRTDNNQYQLTVLANDSDVDEDTLTIDGASTSVGTVTFNAQGLTLTAPDRYVGPVSLRYTVTDGNGGRANADVNLIVEGGEASNLPVITVPADIEVNATALFTRVPLGTATAVDRNGRRLRVSLINGSLFFAPGEHIVYWQATDADGNTATKAQRVRVNPLVSLSKDQLVTEGSEVEVQVILNGPAPVYPVLVPYAVTGSAGVNDHTLVSGIAEISSGLSTTIRFNTLEDALTESPENVIITLDTSVNRGSQRSSRIVISEANVAPVVSLAVEQNGLSRLTISEGDGVVTVTATVTDANPNDLVTGTWDFGRLDNTTSDQTQLSFDPIEQGPGLYLVSYTATDNGTPNLSATSRVFIVVRPNLPTLGSTDADGDLIPDDQEGFADTDGDGIPDYQDAINECNVMPTELLGQTEFVAEGEPGVCLRLGTVAAETDSGSLQIAKDAIETDNVAVNIGGIFDFIAYGLPEQGKSYSLVIPQRLPVPINAVYRKFNDVTGWVDFVSNERNSVSSTAGERGFCPPPGGAEWAEGLTEGHWCVQVRVEDGGPNDADGIANSAIVDPGGVAVELNGNNLPVAVADEASVRVDTSVDVNVLANDTDADGDALTVNQVNSSFGTVTILADQQLSYTPNPDFVGTDTVIYSITDGKGGTASSELVVDVFSNNAPVAVNDTASTDDRSVILIAVLTNDTDADGDVLTVSAATAQQGTVSIEADQRLRYTPKVGFAGVDTISYTVTDSSGDSASASVNVTVRAYQDVVVDNKSSGGSMTWWMGMVLAGAVMVRRRSVLGLAAVALLSFSPFSQGEDWYLQGSVGQSKADQKQSRLVEELPSGTITAFDDSDTLYGITLGYQLNPSVALEMGYQDSGEASSQITGDSLTPEQYHELVKAVSPVLVDGWTIAARFTLWQNQLWDLEVPLGILNWDSEVESTMDDTTLYSTRDGKDWFLGVQLNYKVSDSWKLGLGYQQLELEANDVSSWMLSLRYDF